VKWVPSTRVALLCILGVNLVWSETAKSFERDMIMDSGGGRIVS
jgi:hypothetical protein